MPGSDANLLLFEECQQITSIINAPPVMVGGSEGLCASIRVSPRGEDIDREVREVR